MIGIQYTRFSRSREIAQGFLNHEKPATLNAMTEQNLINWATDIVKGKHPDDLIVIDHVNRAGPVEGIYEEWP